MRFSDRTQWESSPNALSELLSEIRDSGQPWINLTESNPTRCGFLYPPDFLSPLSGADAFKYEPDARGHAIAREAVRSYYQDRGVSVPLENIILTSSTSEAYSHLFRLLANPGESVLFPRPSYPLFQFLADLNDVALKFYDLKYSEQDGWSVDRESVLSAMDDDVRAMVAVHPNNPTGSYVSMADMDFLRECCASNDLALISDEVFHDYALSKDRSPSFTGHDACLTFVMNGLSKILGMPQMKLSWIVIDGPDDLVKSASERLDVIADTYLSVNTPVQRAWPFWLKHLPDIQSQIHQRVLENYLWLQEYFAGDRNFSVFKTSGGWYAMIGLPDVLNEEEWAMLFLREGRVYVHPGYFFDAEIGTLAVVSLLPSPEVFRRGIETITKLAKIEVSKRGIV